MQFSNHRIKQSDSRQILHAGVAQLVEHNPSKVRAAGSSLVSRSKVADVAQLVERFLGKEEVTGSTPVIGSKYD